MKSDQERQAEDKRRGEFARAIEGADAEHAKRFRESIRKMGGSLPFRKDDRPREQFLADIGRLMRFAGQSRVRKSGPHPVPAHLPTACDPGWTAVIKADDDQFPGASPSYSIPAANSGNHDTTGISKRCFSTSGAISIGAAIGNYCDVEWTPKNQRIEMGPFEGASASGSAFTIYDLSSAVSTRAPSALMAKVDVFTDQSCELLWSGAPEEPGGGLVWCWAKASLDVYIGLNLTGGVVLPHGHDEICIFNRVGSPSQRDSNLNNNFNGDFLTIPTSFDDGDPSLHTLTASIGATNLPDTIVMAGVSIDVVCLRYPGSSGFAGLDYSDYTLYPQIMSAPEIYTKSAPIRLGPFKICGI